MIVYFGDNKQVVDLLNKGETACAKASNADLYKLFTHRDAADLFLDRGHICLNFTWKLM